MVQCSFGKTRPIQTAFGPFRRARSSRPTHPFFLDLHTALKRNETSTFAVEVNTRECLNLVVFHFANVPILIAYVAKYGRGTIITLFYDSVSETRSTLTYEPNRYDSKKLDRESMTGLTLQFHIYSKPPH